jgi:hypothetical protein
MKYTVEAYRDGSAIAFRRVARASTVISTASHYAIDLGADTVWVRDEAGTAVYTYDGMFWSKHRGNAAIEAAINSANEQ